MLERRAYWDMAYDKRLKIMKARRRYDDEVNDPALRPAPRRKQTRRGDKRRPTKPR